MRESRGFFNQITNFTSILMIFTKLPFLIKLGLGNAMRTRCSVKRSLFFMPGIGNSSKTNIMSITYLKQILENLMISNVKFLFFLNFASVILLSLSFYHSTFFLSANFLNHSISFLKKVIDKVDWVWSSFVPITIPPSCLNVFRLKLKILFF